MSYHVEAFFDSKTFTLTYVVYDPSSYDGIVIDPVLDFDQASSKISYESINKVLNFVTKMNLNVHYILETHAHADHLTGAQLLKDKLKSPKICIGRNITKVQKTFKKFFNLVNLDTTGKEFDILLDEDKALIAGSISVKTIFTPGHTPACCSYLIDDILFTGDALFMPDYGTGRCDFPDGSADDLWNSIHEKLYKLPDTTKFYTGHDYMPGGRELKYQSTIAESKNHNIQLKGDTSKNDFVSFRKERDKSLSTPKLLLPSIQINIDAGKLPEKEDNGVSYLKIPILF